ncbi:N-glycosylase/DNA lyase [Thermovibrio ammonificans]
MRSRSNSLLEALAAFTADDARLIEEYDRQFRALKRLYASMNDPELFLKLVVLNALLSYQLSMRGEEYWEKFSDFFSSGRGLEEFPEFLRLYNRRFIGAKLKRFEKALRCVEELFKEGVEPLAEDLSAFVGRLATCMGQKESAKTVVFAAKMFLYGYRVAFGREPHGIEGVEIPLDSRLSKLLPSVKGWRELAEVVGIPPVHLDAVIWVPMGMSPAEVKSLPLPLRSKVERLLEVLKGLRSR